MCDDPLPDETVTLVLRLADDADPEGVAAAARERGGTVERDLRRRALAVRASEAAVADLVEVAGIDAVETDGTVGVDAGDAGEDVDL
jgi:hypothetical protein